MMSLFKKQPWSKDYGQAHDRFYPHPRNYISSHQGRFPPFAKEHQKPPQQSALNQIKHRWYHHNPQQRNPKSD